MTAPPGTPTDLHVLHTLRCIGVSGTARIAEAAGLAEPAAESELIDLAVAGLVTREPGVFGGWGLTAAGRAADAERVAALLDAADARGFAAELATAIAELEAATGRTLGGTRWPLVVSVRSGGRIAMPGMMATVLDVGLTSVTTAVLADETGSRSFALDCRRRLGSGFAAVGRTVPDDAADQLRLAIEAVLASWDSPRARTYRTLHCIAHEEGTAVLVQAMVFGNRDEHSAGGVAFSRDPATGAPGPTGEVVLGGQGEDVVSGRTRPGPLTDLAERTPHAWAALRSALDLLEAHLRDACSVELTVESGALWLLQVRAGGLVGAAAVRTAVDLADAGLLDRREAVRRVSLEHLRHARTPRIAPDDDEVLARGVAASPGVATGRVVTSVDAAVRAAAAGPVILVRPETSPVDLPGIAAAAGLVTARGGLTSHAAVVARSMGRPAVVGVAGLEVTDAGLEVTDGGLGVGSIDGIRIDGRTVDAGTLVTVDGTLGQVVLGRATTTTAPADRSLERLLSWADAISGGSAGRPEAVRLAAAHARLGDRGSA